MRTYFYYVLAAIFLTAILLATTFTLEPVYAVTVNQTNATASVTVNSAVDVTLVNITLAWSGGLDPGTSATANDNNPLIVRINTNTNTKTNISQRGASNFSDGGSNTFFIGNLSYKNDTLTTPTRNFTEAFASPCCEFDNWKNIAQPTTTATNMTTNYWLTIPPSQPAASYTATVTIKTGVFN